MRLDLVTENCRTDIPLVSMLGQLVANNLNSSEKYSLGGFYVVRAYPQLEVSGDAGSMFNIELTHQFMPKLHGIMFYDCGPIKINQHNFLAVIIRALLPVQE